MFCSMMHYYESFLGLNSSLNYAFLINVVHFYLFFNYSIYLHNQQQRASKPKHEWQSLNENLFIDRWSSFVIFHVPYYFSKKYGINN